MGLRLSRSALHSPSLTQTWLLVKNTPFQEVFLFPHSLPHEALYRGGQPGCPWGSCEKAGKRGLNQYAGQQPEHNRLEWPPDSGSYVGGLALTFFSVRQQMLSLNKITKGSGQGNFWEQRKNILPQKLFCCSLCLAILQKKMTVVKLRAILLQTSLIWENWQYSPLC